MYRSHPPHANTRAPHFPNLFLLFFPLPSVPTCLCPRGWALNSAHPPTCSHFPREHATKYAKIYIRRRKKEAGKKLSRRSGDIFFAMHAHQGIFIRVDFEESVVSSESQGKVLFYFRRSLRLLTLQRKREELTFFWGGEGGDTTTKKKPQTTPPPFFPWSPSPVAPINSFFLFLRKCALHQSAKERQKGKSNPLTLIGGCGDGRSIREGQKAKNLFFVFGSASF